MDVFADGTVLVYCVSGQNTIPNIASPTLAQITGGFRVSQWLTKDGLVNWEGNTDPVDDSNIESTHDDELAGRINHKGAMLRIKKQDVSDTAYNTLVYGWYGFVVIRRHMVVTTALATGQECEVYPVHAGQVRNLPPEANTKDRYEVPLFVRSKPELRAIIA